MNGMGDPVAETERSKILVVDSEEDVVTNLQRLLRHDYDVTVTAAWEYGLELLAEIEFAVVIVSDTLPWLGGVEFLQRAHTIQPHTCRILMGTTPKNDRVIQAINNARVHYYLSRPWQGAAFKDMIAHEVHLAQEERRLAHEHQHYRRLLLDDATGLPCRAMLMEKAVSRLSQHGFLALLHIDATALWAYQTHLSQRDFATLRDHFLNALRILPSDFLRRDDYLCVEEVSGPRFWVFLDAPRDERIGTGSDAQTVSTRLRQRLAAAVEALHIPHVNQHAANITGVFSLYDPRMDSRFQVQQLLARALAPAVPLPGEVGSEARASALRRVLEERSIRTLFQPIVSLHERHVLGYEALSRGPVAIGLESPELLLTLAEKAGLSFELDRLLRSMALTHAVQLPADKKVFVNTLASTAHDPDLAASRLSRFLGQLDIHPSRVIFEFSERCNIGNHDVLMETLQNYRSLGVGLAIDDVGAGYSGLERIVALHPNYLKIDRSLMQDLHKLPVKRAVLQALVNLAETLGAEVIAEGIEQNADAQALADLGIKYGQGHLLGRPAHPAPSGWTQMTFLPL